MSQLPGMSSAIQHCFEAAAVEPEALQHLDLYSCFPCVVQVRSHHTPAATCGKGWVEHGCLVCL